MRPAHLLEKLAASGLIGKALPELDHAHGQNMCRVIQVNNRVSQNGRFDNLA
jgi:hypothetical protein